MSQRQKIKMTGLNAILIGLIATLVFNGWFLYYNFNNVTSLEDQVQHTNSLVSELDLFLSSMKDAETGFRGFLLTRDRDFLEPYKNGSVEIWTHVSHIKELVANSSAQRESLAALEEAAKTRLKIFQDGIQFFSEPQRIRPVDTSYLRQGKLEMDAIRRLIDNMKSQEQKILEARAAGAAESRMFFYWSLILTTLLGVAVISAAFLQIRAHQKKTLEENRRKTDEAWIKGQIAEVNKIVSGDVSLTQSGPAVLKFVAETFRALRGNLYTLDGRELRLTSAYAKNIESSASKSVVSTANDFKKPPASVPIGEGLLGEAFRKSEPYVVEAVPAHYMTIQSSLGEAAPRQLVFIPIHFQGKNIAILELAVFQAPSDEQWDLVLTLGENIGVGVNAAQSRERLQLLLEETQQQSEELQAQQEELRTNNEELEQQSRALESQSQVLSYKNDELEQTRRDVENKARDLELASQYKSEFLAKMSHELRTPLNSLLILATLLIENKERNLNVQQKDFARSIYDAGNDLLSLINDILDLSKIEARKLALRPDHFTIESLVRQMQSTFKPQAEAKNLKFIVDTEGSVLRQEIFTDRQRLEQILRNFFSNALKFTESGRITFKVTAANESFLAFTVQDSGIGIPASKKNLIFEAFEQADSSVSRKYGGTGLGLTISRELAVLLGGQIRVESTEGEGSQFTVEIPLSMPQTDVAAAPPARTREVNDEGSLSVRGISASEMGEEAARALHGVNLNAKTILIVEDDDKFRMSVAEAARTYGFEPIEVGRGDTAIEILNRHVPSAILLDIKLPGISGMGLLEIIKQRPELRPVPIHMISAMEYQQNALRMGAMGFLAKPVTIEKVRSALSRIENLLSRKFRRLLIVEDDERQRDSIQKLVAGQDVEISTAHRGAEALKTIQEKAFDCIILDLSLPDVSGFDLLEKLNSLEISLPPIVIYTGKDLSRSEEEYLRKYSESIIIKGAKSPDRLLDEVNLFLHRVEATLPEDKKQMLVQLRAQEKAFEGKSVLVVDDDLRNTFALTSALEGKGFVVRIARDGFQALEALTTAPPIDVVLMDIMMPKMDGYEAIRRIREMPAYKNLPIIALTAKAMKGDYEKCLEAGANDYLPKPINLMNLTSVLKVWLTPKGMF